MSPDSTRPAFFPERFDAAHPGELFSHDAIQLKSYLGFGGKNPLAILAALLAAIAPRFVLTMSGWISGVLFTASLVALIDLARTVSLSGIKAPPAPFKLRCVMLSLPLAAILISSCIRQAFTPPLFDSPSRFLSAIPLFHQPDHRGAGRMSTYFADPLSFGLLCLVSLNLLGRACCRC